MLQLTPIGETLYRKTLPEVLDVGRRLIGPLTAAEQRSLLRALTKIVALHDRAVAVAEGRRPVPQER